MEKASEECEEGADKVPGSNQRAGGVRGWHQGEGRGSLVRPHFLQSCLGQQLSVAAPSLKIPTPLHHVPEANEACRKLLW